MFVWSRMAGQHRDQQVRAAVPGRGPHTPLQFCLLQAGCLVWKCGFPMTPGASIHSGELRPPSCMGPGSESTSPSPAACSSILAGPLSSGNWSGHKEGKQLWMGGTGMRVPGWRWGKPRQLPPGDIYP